MKNNEGKLVAVLIRYYPYIYYIWDILSRSFKRTTALRFFVNYFYVLQNHRSLLMFLSFLRISLRGESSIFNWLLFGWKKNVKIHLDKWDKSLRMRTRSDWMERNTKEKKFGWRWMKDEISTEQILFVITVNF